MGTKSKRYAEQLRLFTERSNAVHEQYLSDPELLQNYEYFLDWQAAYILPFYSEFEDKPETAAALEFVVSDLVSTGASARDADLARIIPIMVRLLPGKALQAVASAMRLNARAIAINLDVCQQLFEKGDMMSGISERDYCDAFRRSTTLDECRELIRLILNLGHALKRMVRSPLLGMTLRAMHHPAHAAGFGAMQDFLEKGYSTFHAIEEVDDFLDRFAERMTVVFTRTCEGPLEDMNASTWSPSN